MIDFLFWFIITIALIAAVIIGLKWLMSIAGIAIPPPLLAILGIMFFIMLMFVLWHFVGAAAWNSYSLPPHR